MRRDAFPIRPTTLQQGRHQLFFTTQISFTSTKTVDFRQLRRSVRSNRGCFLLLRQFSASKSQPSLSDLNDCNARSPGQPADLPLASQNDQPVAFRSGSSACSIQKGDSGQMYMPFSKIWMGLGQCENRHVDFPSLGRQKRPKRQICAASNYTINPSIYRVPLI